MKRQMPSKFFEYFYRAESKLIDAASRNKSPIAFSAGLLFCVVIVTLPELLPAIHGREGFVWSPIHSQNYRLGDLYYYGAWLKEVLESGIPAYSPTAGELYGQPLIETWRFLGILLAAMPGYIISDIRMLIVFDYGLSAALFFSIAYFFAYSHTQNWRIALFAGLAVLFITDQLWVPVRAYAESLAASWGIAASAFKTMADYLIYKHNFIEYDIYGSTFRFINISLSGPIVLLYYFLVTIVYKNTEIKTCFILLFLSPLMAFTYPSHTIIAYGLIATFCIVSLFRRKLKTSVYFFSVGIFTILFLEIIKYRKMMSELFIKSELWNGIFASEKLELLNNEISFILTTVLLNKYLLTFLIMLYLSRNRHILRDIVVATGMVAIPLSTVYIFNMPQLWGRFLERGIDHIWFMLLIVVLGNAIYQHISKPEKIDIIKTLSFSVNQRILSISVFVVFGTMVTLISFGFFNLAKHTTSSGSRYIPEATMNAYKWIDSNLPLNAEVATLDWEDITLLPVFTNVNLVVGHSVIDGRNPADELKRFIAAWKYLGYDRQQLEILLDIGPEACLQMRRAASYTNPPRLPLKYKFEAAQFMAGILYWPYIKKVNRIQIAEDTTTSKLTFEFKDFVLMLYNNSRPDDFIQKYKVQYITMSTEQVSLLGPPKGMRLVHKTKTRSIFALPT